MQVTTINHGNAKFVCLKNHRADMTVLIEANETPVSALQRTAAECRIQALRLLARAERCDAGIDALQTSVG